MSQIKAASILDEQGEVERPAKDILRDPTAFHSYLAPDLGDKYSKAEVEQYRQELLDALSKGQADEVELQHHRQALAASSPESQQLHSRLAMLLSQAQEQAY